MDLTRPFLGSTAVAAGIVTPKQLRGPRFRSPMHGVHVAVSTPNTFLLRCEAAALVVGALHDLAGSMRGVEIIAAGIAGTGMGGTDRDSGIGTGHAPGAAGRTRITAPDRRSDGARTALAGWAAAEMLGADCAPPGVVVDVLVTDGHRRSPPGLRARHRLVLPGEVVVGVPIPAPVERPPYVLGRTVTTTSARRTALDLACEVERIEAVIALDALSRVGGFDPAEVLDLAARHRGTRGVGGLPALVRVASPLAESPMETRIRLALHDHRVPTPVLQHPVGDYRIDLAYPDLKVGIEYDGHHHLDPVRARKDLVRQAFLTARGWEILRPEAWMVHRRPDQVAAMVWSQLGTRSRR